MVLRMGALPNGGLRGGRKKSCLRPSHPAPYYTKNGLSYNVQPEDPQLDAQRVPKNTTRKKPNAHVGKTSQIRRPGGSGGAGGWRLWEWPEPSSRGPTHAANPQVLRVELAMASPKTKLLRSPREDWK